MFEYYDTDSIKYRNTTLKVKQFLNAQYGQAVEYDRKLNTVAILNNGVRLGTWTGTDQELVALQRAVASTKLSFSIIDRNYRG